MGKKKSLAESRAEKVKKYEEKRKSEGKVDMDFPVADSELRRRVCETEADVDKVVERHLKAADIEASQGGCYWLVLDVENFLIDFSTANRHKMPGSDVAIRQKLPDIAKKAKMGYCRAHKPSPLFEAEDVDDNVVWHMALELELIKRVSS